jgi:aspartyl/asparaginyl beta-hydroxylase (cupin superfamily)
MSTTFVSAVSGRQRAFKVGKFIVKRILLPLGVVAPFAFFFPKVAALYVICGGYDVTRNRGVDLSTLRRYFTGNGVLTWLLSPFNTLLDLLSLPYVNKGVYRPEDLPPAYQDEVKRLIKVATDENLVAKIEERSKEFPRTMIFFKWYGVNVDTFLDIPAFHQPWKYVRTIGVSVFNKKVSTSKHFGFLRPSLRLLYNLNDMKDDSAYIVVGDTTSYWRENKLFIFDDTLLHQSFNETEQTRYCLFVDIIRPTPFPYLMSGVISAVRLLTESCKFVFYKHWKVIDR